MTKSDLLNTTTTTAAAAPTSAAFNAAIDAAVAASARFNALPENLEVDDRATHEAEMTILGNATQAADMAIPTTWQEYTRLIEHMTDNGLSTIDDDNGARLLAHARRLSNPTPTPDLAALLAVCSEAEATVERHQREVLDVAGFAAQDKAIQMAQIKDNNELNSQWVTALDAVANFPASTIAELQIKLAYMTTNKMGDGVDWLSEIQADVERIAVGTSTPEWDAALSDFEKKAAAFGAAMNAHDKASLRLFADRTPENDKAYDESEKATEDRCAESCEAVRVLVALPAPNAKAAMIKAQIALDSGQMPGTGMADILRADLRRFTNYANQEA